MAVLFCTCFWGFPRLIVACNPVDVVPGCIDPFFQEKYEKNRKFKKIYKNFKIFLRCEIWYILKTDEIPAQDMVEKGETFCENTCKMSLFTCFVRRTGACQMFKSRVKCHQCGE